MITLALVKNKVFNRDYDQLAKYCQEQSTGPDQLLKDLERETYLKTLAPQMLSGQLQGKFLELLAGIQGAKSILEVGTFTGYASICLARGLAAGGHLHTIEINPELQYISSKYFKLAGFQDVITSHIGDAKEIIPSLNQSFDIVFLDGAKVDYAILYPMVKNCLRPGGLLLVDNVLWSGKVFLGATDKMTKIMRTFNESVRMDKEVEVVILPMRDGLMLVRKL